MLLVFLIHTNTYNILYKYILTYAYYNVSILTLITQRGIQRDKRFKSVQRRHMGKDNGVRAVDADEFLSGIKKDDRFHPIINIILYYGEKEWDGPVSLKDMMVDMPERFANLFADYEINLVQMLDSGRLLFHNEDVRILFDVVSNIYKRNIDYIYSKYDGTEVDGELFWIIGKITSNENMLEISRDKKGESVVMCKAWREYYDEARRDGAKSATLNAIIFMIKYGISKRIY